MRSINFVVLGEQTIANDFGKKGTVTDPVSYTHLTLPTNREV